MDLLSSLFDVEMSIHGWIALGLTVVGVTALHLWLMRLALKPWDPDAPGDPAQRSSHPADHGEDQGGWHRRDRP